MKVHLHKYHIKKERGHEDLLDSTCTEDIGFIGMVATEEQQSIRVE